MYQRMKYFLKAAETGSFSVAAREMYISPPALAKQINILEDEVGGKLFIRTPQGVRLTHMGQVAYQKLSVVSMQTEAALEELKNYAKNDKTQVKLGFFSALPADELVTPVISFLMTFYPQYQITFEMLEMEEGKRKLDDGQLDMLLTQVPEEERQTGWRYLSFGEQEARVLVSLTHPWVMKEQLSVDDLQKETFLRFPTEESRDSQFLHVPCKESRTISNYNTILMMLRQGEGFTLFPIDDSGVRQAHLKSFVYPGESLLFNTALLFRQDNKLVGLGKIVDDLTSEFDLIPC